MHSLVESALLVLLSLSSTLSAGIAVEAAQLRSERLLSRSVLSALAWNFIAVPLVAWSAVQALGVRADLASGVLLAAVAPGGSTGPLLALLSRGEPALTVVLFALVSLTATVLVPPLCAGLTAGFGSFGTGFMTALLGLLLGQFGPLLLGMFLRHRWPVIAQRIGKVAGQIGLALLVLVIIGMCVTRGHLLGGSGARALGASAITVAASLALWWGLTGIAPAVRAAAVQVTAIRNLTLALLLCALLRLPPGASVGVLVYGLAMYGLAGVAAALLRGRTTRR